MTAEQPYVLGTGSDELERLGLQHQLWSDAAHDAWRRAEISIGQRVLDVGAGPGYASFDMAQMVTQQGAVVAVDESEPFLAHLEAQARTRGLPQITAYHGDAQHLDAALGDEAPFDLAYARWVLCFVADPQAVIDGTAARLRLGGRFVIHDYFNYAAMTLAPRSAPHDRAVAATVIAWRGRGGDPDVVERLPQMLERAGFDVSWMRCLQRTARGGESMFTWVDTWWHTFGPKLVELGLFATADCDALLAELAAMRIDRTRFIQCPPVFELIAQKR